MRVRDTRKEKTHDCKRFCSPPALLRSMSSCCFSLRLTRHGKVRSDALLKHDMLEVVRCKLSDAANWANPSSRSATKGCASEMRSPSSTFWRAVQCATRVITKRYTSRTKSQHITTRDNHSLTRNVGISLRRTANKVFAQRRPAKHQHVTHGSAVSATTPSVRLWQKSVPMAMKKRRGSESIPMSSLILLTTLMQKRVLHQKATPTNTSLHCHHGMRSFSRTTIVIKKCQGRHSMPATARSRPAGNQAQERRKPLTPSRSGTDTPSEALRWQYLGKKHRISRLWIMQIRIIEYHVSVAARTEDNHTDALKLALVAWCSPPWITDANRMPDAATNTHNNSAQIAFVAALRQSFN
mmetsp:Transcript_50562/g.134540  ORF Transcript_50562/g.134540 Transcript_50562/m.134540 type:complete len:353 (+) Transcript_50562:1178-2236(+)